MNRVLWIGPRSAPPALATLLEEQDGQLLSFPGAAEAVQALGGMEAAVAIVTADWADAPQQVSLLAAERPDVQILLASDQGIARNVVLALWAGASGVLEFKTQTRQEIVLEIQEWITRHRQRGREVELLQRLHALNDEFLKEVVTAQRRTLELEAELGKAPKPLLPFETAAEILVVDDEEVVHDVLQRILERAGHHVHKALTGEQAMQQVYERAFHLVITDKNLPDWSGLDVMKQVKELSPETDVMMITGYSSKETAIQALDLGAAAYLEKPFDDIKKVVERVEGVLGRQKTRLTQRHYLNVIKERNREFLDRYRALRADLEAWLETRGAK